MVNASHHCLRCRLAARRLYDEQIIARPRARVQPQHFLWFPADAANARFLRRRGKSSREAVFAENRFGIMDFERPSESSRARARSGLGTRAMAAQKKSRRCRRL